MTSYLMYVPCVLVVMTVLGSFVVEHLSKKYRDEGHYGFVS